MTTNPKPSPLPPPYILTYEEWQRQLADYLRRRYPTASPEALATTLRSRDLEWARAIEEHAQGHRLADHVLDSFLAKYGQSLFSRTFRGRAEQSGYFSPDIRAFLAANERSERP